MRTEAAGDVARVAALGRCTQADTYLLVRIDAEPITTPYFDAEAEAAFRTAYQAHRKDLAETAARIERSMAAYDGAYDAAASEYKASGGAFVTDDAPDARGVDAREAYTKHRAQMEAALADLRARGDALAVDARQYLERKLTEQGTVTFGVTARARLTLVDVATSQVLLLGRLAVAGTDSAEAETRMAEVVAGRVLAHFDMAPVMQPSAALAP